MSYKNGGTGKGSAIRQGLDKEKFEDRMEEIRKSKKVEDSIKEVTKSGNKTTYKY
jgi:hypothetical protein